MREGAEGAAESGLQRVRIGAHQLAFLWCGPPPDERPTLVMLHEGLGCASLSRDLPAQLAEATGLGVLAYSRAGYGGSSPLSVGPRPVDYLRTEGTQVLPALLGALGVRRAVLFGHSDGATLAFAHLATRASAPRVRGAVLLAPHSFVEEMCLSAIRSTVQAYGQGDLRQRLARWHGSNVDCAFWGWSGMWLDPAFKDFSLVDELRLIGVPLLAIQGTGDQYGTLEQLAVLQRCAGGPVELLVLEGAGHAPQRDAPERVIEATRRFVAGLALDG